jgi:hypothetical protein
MKTTTKLLSLAALGGLMVMASGTASARDNFSLNLDLGGPAYYAAAPQPVIVRPAPGYVYAPAPVTRVVYTEPGYYRPYYYGNRVIIRDRWGHPGWHHGWR